MTKPRTTTSLLVMCVMLVGACTSSSTDSADSTSATTSTTTTTVAPATTTTTTTLPPGLQPQVLKYQLTPYNIWTHATTIDLTIGTEIVELNLEGVTLDDIGDEVNTVVRTIMSGDTKTLFLPSENGSFEAVFDMKPDEGTVEVTSGSTTLTETLSAADLNAEDVPLPPAVMTPSGAVGDGTAGAPGLHRLDNSLQAILGSLGPLFSEEAVDVGDTWEFDGRESLYGLLEGTATITDEIEYGDDFAFVIEYASEFVDLPTVFGSEDLNANDSAQAEAILDMAFAFLAPGDEMEVEIVRSKIEGTATFSPTLGIPVELELMVSEAIVLSISAEDMGMTMDFTVDATTTYVFEEQDEAASFEIANVLSQFEADPYLLADYALTPLYGYIVDEPDTDAADSVLQMLFTTPAEVAGGFSAVGVSEDYDAWVDVFALTNGGSMRGFPSLANELIYLWTGSEGRSVSVGGSTAYRTTIDGREWLVWNSDTHTFIVVGPRSLAKSVVETLIASQNPYLWRQGDCLEFRDFYDEVPFSPFGEYGLRHCSHGHEYEVLYSEELDEGPDAPYPDDIGQRTNRACGQRFVESVGVYPLESNVGLVSYLPSEDEWDRGARYVACVIYLEDADGPVTLDSRFDTATAETDVSLAVGDCLADTFQVPCTDPHNAEITATNEFEAPLDAEYPDFGDVFDELDGVCEAALDEYGVTEGDAEVISFSNSDMALGWDAGVRTYYCVAVTVTDGWPVATTGSLQGEWEIAPEQFDA